MSADKSKIEQLAYRIWENEGRPQGRAIDHWLQAEALVTVKAPKARAPSAAKAKATKADKPKAAKAAKPAKSAPAAAAAKV